MSEPRYPGVSVPMVGHDGNAFAILGRVTTALRQAGVDPADVAEFRQQAMSGDYHTVLRTVMEWVDVDGENEETV